MAATPFAAELIATANAIAAAGKGILAADESAGTIGKRFESISASWFDTSEASEAKALHASTFIPTSLLPFLAYRRREQRGEPPLLPPAALHDAWPRRVHLRRPRFRGDALSQVRRWHSICRVRIRAARKTGEIAAIASASLHCASVARCILKRL